MAQDSNKYPLVSIITVNYNQAEVTCDLIASLHKISYPNFEIIVIDNASPTEKPGIIKERFPNVILIENPINYGFAAGNNFGLMRARGSLCSSSTTTLRCRPDFSSHWSTSSEITLTSGQLVQESGTFTSQTPCNMLATHR